MLILIVATTLLALFYGLFWHNQPANECDRARADDNHKEELRVALGLRRTMVPAYPPRKTEP